MLISSKYVQMKITIKLTWSRVYLFYEVDQVRYVLNIRTYFFSYIGTLICTCFVVLVVSLTAKPASSSCNSLSSEVCRADTQAILKGQLWLENLECSLKSNGRSGRGTTLARRLDPGRYPPSHPADPWLAGRWSAGT